jgi:organic radical activating enzyme
MAGKYIYILMTNICHQNCSFCLACRPKSPVFFSFERFKEILNEHGDFNQICLTGGGEPLLHPQICDFIDYAIRDNTVKVYTALPNIEPLIELDQPLLRIHNSLNFSLLEQDKTINRIVTMIENNNKIKYARYVAAIADKAYHPLSKNRITTIELSLLGFGFKDWQIEKIPIFDFNPKEQEILPTEVIGQMFWDNEHPYYYSSDGKEFRDFCEITKYQLSLN